MLVKQVVEVHGIGVDFRCVLGEVERKAEDIENAQDCVEAAAAVTALEEVDPPAGHAGANSEILLTPTEIAASAACRCDDLMKREWGHGLGLHA